MHCHDNHMIGCILFTPKIAQCAPDPFPPLGWVLWTRLPTVIVNQYTLFSQPIDTDLHKHSHNTTIELMEWTFLIQSSPRTTYRSQLSCWQQQKQYVWYSATSIIQTSFVQELQLSRLAGEQQMHYYPCTEGVADDVCGCDDRLGDELDRATMVLQICLGQNWLTSVLFQTLLAIIILSFLQAKYRHLSCPDYFTYTGMADQPVDKGVQIIKVAL